MSLSAHNSPASTGSHQTDRHECSTDECPEEYHPDGRYHCNRPGCLALYDAPGAHGSFCSDVCYYRHKGYAAFANIADDHRLCSTCFREIKEIEEWPEWIEGHVDNLVWDARCGFQYETQQTTWATDAFGAPNPYLSFEAQRWGCECGDVDGTSQEFAIRKADPAPTLASLYRCLVALDADGDRIAHAPSKGAMFDAYRERPLDWPYVAGRAIYCE